MWHVGETGTLCGELNMCNCIWLIDHGGGDIMLAPPFYVDKIAYLLHALAHSHRELRELTADIFFESVAFSASYFLDLPVGVAREE